MNCDPGTRHRVVMISGGLGSWMTAKRVVEQHGSDRLTLLFADTLIEDGDVYRFLVQSAANVVGVTLPTTLVDRLNTVPKVCDPVGRKAYLSDLATDAMSAVPGFVWLMDGRTPWEVFHDAKFIGNSRVAQCSHKLKQDPCRDWLTANLHPDATTVYVGIDWSESPRFFGKGGKPGAKDHWLPYACEAPLCDPPYLTKTDVAKEAERNDLDPPRLYDLGFPHANCGGFCVRGGHAHFKRLLDQLPEVYAYHEMKEEEMRDYLKKDVAIMRDRRGGQSRPLPMVEFRERFQDDYDRSDWGGCGCFLSERPTDEVT
jgi:hypothetical protein